MLAEFELLEHATHLRLTYDALANLLEPQLLEKTYVFGHYKVSYFLDHGHLLVLFYLRRLGYKLSEVVAEHIYLNLRPLFDLFMLFEIIPEDVPEYFFDELDIQKKRIDLQILYHFLLADSISFSLHQLQLYFLKRIPQHPPPCPNRLPHNL